MDRDFFETSLKNALYLKALSTKPSRNIFREAWHDKGRNINNEKNPTLIAVRKFALITTCLISILTATIFSVSVDARNAVLETYKAVTSYFLLEKSRDQCNIVEKQEDEAYDNLNFGGLDVTESNKKEIENLVGFDIFVPEKVGQSKKQGYPLLGMTLFDFKLSEQISSQDKLMIALQDENFYQKEFSRYQKQRNISQVYIGKGLTYYFHISKQNSYYKTNNTNQVISTEKIEGVDCDLVEVGLGVYPIKRGDGYCYEDKTQPPYRINKYNYVEWNYDGKSFSVTIPLVRNFDKEKEFAKEYLRALKANINHDHQ